MGSCVSKKAAGGRGGKVAAPLPVVEKEGGAHALPPVAEVDAEQEEEEEVKEVVLSETPAPRPPRPPPPEPVKRRQQQPEPEEHEAASETCSAASDGAASSVEFSAEMAKAKLQKPGVEMDVEKRAAADAPAKRRAAPPEEEKPEGKQPKCGSGRARSPSPSPAHRKQQQPVSSGHPPAPARPRREHQQQHPPVVSGIGCRCGRFSPSAARRAAESAVRRTHSAREADMALPSKRSLTAGYAAGGGALSRRDPGERSGRRSDSPTGSRRAPASPSATTHRPASPMRKAGKEHGHGTPERARPPRVRDGDELAGSEEEEKKVAEGEAGALGQNPSVAMECFIFL